MSQVCFVFVFVFVFVFAISFGGLDHSINCRSEWFIVTEASFSYDSQQESTNSTQEKRIEVIYNMLMWLKGRGCWFVFQKQNNGQLSIKY